MMHPNHLAGWLTAMSRPSRDRPDSETENQSRKARAGSVRVARQAGRKHAAKAAMVITTDSPVPRDVLDEVVAGEGFEAGRTVTLQDL